MVDERGKSPFEQLFTMDTPEIHVNILRRLQMHDLVELAKARPHSSVTTPILNECYRRIGQFGENTLNRFKMELGMAEMDEGTHHNLPRTKTEHADFFFTAQLTQFENRVKALISWHQEANKFFLNKSKAAKQLAQEINKFKIWLESPRERKQQTLQMTMAQFNQLIEALADDKHFSNKLAKGYSALWIAACLENKEITEALLATKKTNPNFICFCQTNDDNTGQTPLSVFIRYCQKNLRTQEGFIFFNNFIKMLLKAGAKPHLSDIKYDPIQPNDLCFHLGSYDLEVFTMMVTAQGSQNINARGEEDLSRFHFLTRFTNYGCYEIKEKVALLLKLGADPNAGQHPCPPLHEFAENGEIDAVRLLINHPLIDLTRKDEAQLTAAQVASDAGHDEIAALINQRIAEKAAAKIAQASSSVSNRPQTRAYTAITGQRRPRNEDDNERELGREVQTFHGMI